jgi:hypothetical protein
MSFHRTLDMGLTREEFLRFLPAAVGRFEVDGQAIVCSHADHRCTIRLVPLPPRRVASVVVSRHRVEITLEGCSEEEGRAFVDTLTRTFLRGGG